MTRKMPYTRETLLKTSTAPQYRPLTYWDRLIRVEHAYCIGTFRGSASSANASIGTVLAMLIDGFVALYTRHPLLRELPQLPWKKVEGSTGPRAYLAQCFSTRCR